MEKTQQKACTIKEKHPLLVCRCAEMQKALNNVEFSLAGAQCMRVVIDEICDF